MKSVTFSIPVDTLPDYNEQGAMPGEANYDIIVLAEVSLPFKDQDLEIREIHLYDTGYCVSLSTKILSSRDLLAVKEEVRRYVDDHLAELVLNEYDDNGGDQ